MHSFPNQNFSTHCAPIRVGQSVVKLAREAFVHDEVEIRALRGNVIVNHSVQSDLGGFVFIKEKGIWPLELQAEEIIIKLIEDRNLWFCKKGTSRYGLLVAIRSRVIIPSMGSVVIKFHSCQPVGKPSNCGGKNPVAIKRAVEIKIHLYGRLSAFGKKTGVKYFYVNHAITPGITGHNRCIGMRGLRKKPVRGN